MPYRPFARPAVALLAIAAFVACQKSATSTMTPSTAAVPTTAPALPFSSMMVAQGDSLFHARSCVRCHGADAKGAKNGPNLTTPPFLHMTGSYDEIVGIITNGMPADSIKDKAHQFPMRARGGQKPLLTDDQVRAIAAYVYSLSHT